MTEGKTGKAVRIGDRWDCFQDLAIAKVYQLSYCPSVVNVETTFIKKNMALKVFICICLKLRA